MRDLLTGLAILVILALAAATAAPWFVDWNAWRGEVEKHLTEALGRDVRIGGPLSIRLLPQPHISARKVSIDAAQAPASLTIESLDIELGLTAMLGGQLRITDGSMERPVLVWRDAPALRQSLPPPEPGARDLAIDRLAIRGGEIRSFAADGRLQFAATSDFVIEQSALNGPWKAQGRAEIDGGRYDIRWSSGAVAPDGRAALKVSVQDASLAFIGEAEGMLVIDRAGWKVPPRFEGRISASGMTPWPFGRAPGPQPWRLAATGGGDSAGFEASAMELEIGPQDVGVKADGEGALRYANGLSARVALKLRPMDFDRMLAVDPGQNRPPAPVETVAEIERLLAAIPFPIVFDLQAERAYARAESLGPLRVNGRMEPGAVTLDQVEAEGPGGLKATAKGRLWIDSEPAFEATANLSTGAPAKAWQWLSGAPPDIAANQRFVKASSVSASGRVRWRPGRIAFDQGVVTVDGAQAQVEIQRRFSTPGDPGRFGLTVRADTLDLDLMPAVEWLPPADGPDIDLVVSARRVVSAALGVSVGSFDLDARQQAGVLTLSKLAVSQKGLSLSADGMVKDGVGRFAADIAADDLKPLAAVLQRAFPGAYADAFAARASALSPARFNGSMQPSRDGKRWLARAEGVAGGTRFAALADAPRGGDAQAKLDSLRIKAEAPDSGKLVTQLGWDAGPLASPGSLALDIATGGGAPAGFTLNATIAGAAIEASAKAVEGLAPSLTGTLRLNAADLAPALGLLKLPAAGPSARPGWLESSLDYGAGGLRLASLRGELGELAVRSGALQISLGAQPRATGQVEVEALSLADLSTLAFGVSGAAPSGAFWSSQRFPAFARAPVSFDLDLRARAFDLGGGRVAANAATRLVSRNDGLRIETLSAEFGGGRFNGEATIRRDGSQAAVTGRVGATQLDLTALGASGLTGLVDLSLDFSSAGDSIARLVSGLAGAGSATLRRASLPQVDAGAAARIIAIQDKSDAMPSLDDLTPMVERELARGALPLEAVSAPLTITGGAARLGPARAETLAAFLVGSSQIDLKSWTIDARIQMTGKAPAGATVPDIGLAYTGAILSPKRAIDIAALFSEVTQRAAAREAARVQILEQDARERAAFNRRLRYDRNRLDAEKSAAEPALTPPPPPGPFALPPVDATPAQ
ncbi:MAG: hypothetical protein BGP06_19225 [Rhizobiales bacterium 65-9]|mgnify:CR=1 FL=1|nr:MAG: hypothetical protein BGP06_19225 [Rhizobiales bacterium 65-9]